MNKIQRKIAGIIFKYGINCQYRLRGRLFTLWGRVTNACNDGLLFSVVPDKYENVDNIRKENRMDIFEIIGFLLVALFHRFIGFSWDRGSKVKKKT